MILIGTHFRKKILETSLKLAPFGCTTIAKAIKITLIFTS